MNLLTETIEAINNSSHELKDIVYIRSQSSNHYCTWDEFCSLVNQFYSDICNYKEIELNLIIVFLDGARLFRTSYEGTNWWNYQEPLQINNSFIKTNSLEKTNKDKS